MKTISIVIGEIRFDLRPWYDDRPDRRHWRCELGTYELCLTHGTPIWSEDLEPRGATAEEVVGECLTEVLTPDSNGNSYVFNQAEALYWLGKSDGAPAPASGNQKWKMVDSAIFTPRPTIDEEHETDAMTTMELLKKYLK